MSLRVVMVGRRPQFSDYLLDKLNEKGVEFSLIDSQTEDGTIEACRNADFIIIRDINRRIIEHLEKCKFIETLGIGYDAIDVEAATEHGIGVIHNPGFCKEELSDHAMALILACSRWILGLYSRVKMGNRVPAASPEALQHMSILRGKTLGLIGFGNSGRALVPKARGFGMNILAYSPHVDRGVMEELKVEKVSFDRLLEESDFISIHTNLTSENEHLFGLEEFKKMKDSAFIINISRGRIINEPDLYTALLEGYIAGAGLDVTDPEPPAKDGPLFKFDNVIVTGHNAGTSPDSFALMRSFPIEEIGRIINRQWPIGLVNPEVKEKYTAKWGPMSEPEN